MKILNRFNGSTIYEGAALTVSAAIAECWRSGKSLTSANLRGADLRDADLSSANLRSADLRGANLRSADLFSANLRSADLSGANLRSANLRSADLSGANLSGANLRSADLSGADLRSADLSSADLSGANLRHSSLDEVNLKKIVSIRSIVPEGDLRVYKKLKDGSICTLLIPARAKRVGGVVGRKCRAEYARVISGRGVSWRRNTNLVYKRGKLVRPDKFDPNPLVECSHGIHFFITRAEAESYDWS